MQGQIKDAEKLSSDAKDELESLKKVTVGNNKEFPKAIEQAANKDEFSINYSKVVGGENNMSKRVSEWPSNEYLKNLTAQELVEYQITSINWAKGTHHGEEVDYCNSLRFINNFGHENPLYSDKTPDASFSTHDRIAKISCRTNYSHVYAFKFQNDFGEVIGKPIYSRYDEDSADEYDIEIGLDEKLVGFKVWESDWVDCKTSKIAFKILKSDQFLKDEAFIARVKKHQMASQCKLINDIVYFWTDGSAEKSQIEFKKDGTINWNNEPNKGTWTIVEKDVIEADLNGTKHTLSYENEKWTVKDSSISLEETGAPEGDKSWFCIHYADFSSGDKHFNYCVQPTLAKAINYVLDKPSENNSLTAYQLLIGGIKIYTRSAGKKAFWTNEHTGDGKKEIRGNLFIWGTNLGITKNGRTLLCMKDVTIRGGDDKTQEDMFTFQQAFDKVKTFENTESAYSWDAKKKQLVEKPPAKKSGIWSKAPGSWLFMWADKIVTKDMLKLDVPISEMKHKVFPNGMDGMHTWTQSARIAREQGGMLVTVAEAQEYIKKHGPLVKGQTSWTATQEIEGNNRNENWVSCSDQNPEGLGVDYHSHFNLTRKELSEDINHADKGQVVIYKPAPKNLKLYGVHEPGPEARTVKLILMSHNGMAIAKKAMKEESKMGDLEAFTVGDKKNAIEVQIDPHNNGIFIRMNHRFDNMPFFCVEGQFGEGRTVGVGLRMYRAGCTWFVVNNNQTASPTLSPNFCLGLREDKIVLVDRNEPKDGESDERLFFETLSPTLQPEKVMKTVLSSHPGKAIVLTGLTEQQGQGMEEGIMLGDEKDAISIFVDEDNHVHNADKHFQVFDGGDHEDRDLIFFAKHNDYEHQKYKPQEDGTILFLKDQEYVLGTDDSAKRVIHVKKDSPNKLVFRDIKEML